jgi:transcriptional regulator with XRE-family HTH domain
MNINLLRSKIALHGHRDKDLAEILGITKTGVSKKFRGIASFRQSDIEKIICYYKLTPEETTAIFFDCTLSLQDKKETKCSTRTCARL